LTDLVDEMITPPASLKGDDEWVKFVKSAVRVGVICTNYFLTFTEMADVQTTNHPLGEISLVDCVGDMFTISHRHDGNGTTQSWR
jgi:hypothetical protein